MRFSVVKVLCRADNWKDIVRNTNLDGRSPVIFVKQIRLSCQDMYLMLQSHEVGSWQQVN